MGPPWAPRCRPDAAPRRRRKASDRGVNRALQGGLESAANTLRSRVVRHCKRRVGTGSSASQPASSCLGSRTREVQRGSTDVQRVRAPVLGSPVARVARLACTRCVPVPTEARVRLVAPMDHSQWAWLIRSDEDRAPPPGLPDVRQQPAASPMGGGRRRRAGMARTHWDRAPPACSRPPAAVGSGVRRVFSDRYRGDSIGFCAETAAFFRGAAGRYMVARSTRDAQRDTSLSFGRRASHFRGRVTA